MTLFNTLDLASIQTRLIQWWEFADQKSPCLLMSSPRAGAPPVPDTDDLDTWWFDVDFHMARTMASIDGQRYAGQAVPFHFPSLASSAMAGVLGADMRCLDKQTIWPYPALPSVAAFDGMTLDRTTLYYRLHREMTERSVALAHDHHYISPFALEGPADIVAALCGVEKFLMAMVEHPQDVERALETAKRLWMVCFNEFEALIARSDNAGAIGWAGIWAPGPTFPLQEDCSYMFSDTMFRRYCLPHICDIVDAMPYAMYHLDGAAALTHLDTLLSIPNLRAIQWVPGPGRERLDQWYELLQYILAAGKSIEVSAEPDEVDALVARVGTRGLLIRVRGASGDEIDALLERYPS